MRDSGLEEGHGEDRTQSRHTLNSLSFSLRRVSAGPTMFPLLYYVFAVHFLSSSLSLSLSTFHIFITPFPLSISPCVSARVSAEDHTVFHIPPQLMTDSNMEPLNLPPPPHPTPRGHTHTHTHTHTHARTHTISIIFASFEDKSAFFYLFPFPFSLSLPLSLPVDISPKAHHTFS